MLLINLESTDPFFNLAVEEILLKSSNEEYLILGINSPSVIIGKHQVAHRETDTRFVTENNIPVIRRLSGGGTVFHDTGNLNFTFIRQSEVGKQVDFRKYTRPVLDFLTAIGVDARLEGKSDLKVNGLKISGNAEHVHRNRVLHHGTLLFSASMPMLSNSIRKDTSCYSSRAVTSNPAKVTNLGTMLPSFDNIETFRTEMMRFLSGNLPASVPCQLSQTEREQAENLAASKYKTWEWNQAYGPEYTFSNCFTINEKKHSCSIFVKDGIICNFSLEGSEEMEAASRTLTGCRHMVRDVQQVLNDHNVLKDEEEVYNFF